MVDLHTVPSTVQEGEINYILNYAQVAKQMGLTRLLVVVVGVPPGDVYHATQVLLNTLDARRCALAVNAHIHSPSPNDHPRSNVYSRVGMLGGGHMFWSLDAQTTACTHGLGTCQCQNTHIDGNTARIVIADLTVEQSTLTFAAKHQCTVLATAFVLPLSGTKDEGGIGEIEGDESEGVAPTPEITWKRHGGPCPLVEYTWLQRRVRYTTFDLDSFVTDRQCIYQDTDVFGVTRVRPDATDPGKNFELFVIQPDQFTGPMVIPHVTRKKIGSAIDRLTGRPTDDDIARLVRVVAREAEIDARLAFLYVKQMVREQYPMRSEYAAFAFQSYVDSTADQVAFFLSLVQGAALCATVGVTIAVVAPATLVTVPVIAGSFVCAAALGFGACAVARALTPSVIVKTLRQQSWGAHARTFGRLFSIGGWCAAVGEAFGYHAAAPPPPTRRV